MRDGTTRALLHTLPLAALFALACALLAPAPPSLARRALRAAQERPKKETPPADSAVYGRVVYDDTSRPVRRARLLLVNEVGSRPEYNALTGADGAFRIEGVRAGSYFAFVDVPGVLSPVGFVGLADIRGRDPDFTEARKFFDMIEVDGKQDTRVTVRARRGAALGGHVTYADGDPAVNVTVNVMRRGPDGRLDKILAGINITSIAGLRTDDRGVFRVSGLPPGEYVIAVSEAAEHGDTRNTGDMRDPTIGVMEALSGQQFLMPFYPSATKAKDAAVVKAEAGVERSDLDITIPARELHTVGGVVRGRGDKRPVSGAKVTIVSREDGAGGGGDEEVSPYGGNASHNATSTDTEGRWEFREIPEGSYTIHVKPPDKYEDAPAEPAVAVVNVNVNANLIVSSVNTGGGYARTRLKRGYAPTRLDLQVIDGDVADVALELNDGGRVAGTVALESGKEEAYGSLSLRRVPDGAERQTSDDAWGTYSSGGRFEVAGLPAGKYFVQFNAYGDEGKLYVKSVTWNGRDLLREPVEVGEGASVEGVQVVVSSNSSKLRVRALSAAHGRAMSAVAVTLAPPDVASWSYYSQQLTCFTDVDGACEVVAPPGEYRVVTVPAAKTSGSFEEEFKRRAATAPRVTLAAGEAKDFEVTVAEK
jgi:hypothetical protein